MIPGAKFLAFGGAGAGKTWSTKTWFGTGVQPIHLFLEPSMSLISNIPEAKWKYISPMPSEMNWVALMKNATNSNTMSHGDLQTAGVGTRRNMLQFMEVISQLNRFVTDESCGSEDLGDVMDWGTDKCLIIDGLSGLTKTARYLRCGLTPLPPQSDYGIVQFNIYSLIDLLTSNLKCHFVLIAHIEREHDEIGGGFIKTVSTFGRKLAPTLPPLFDDVVISMKFGVAFTWTTIENGADTKNRNLPLKADMPQDFNLLLDAWKANGGVVGNGVG